MLIALNYKMNGSKSFHLNQLKTINKLKLKGTNLVLCPSFVFLHLFSLNKNISLGAQDISDANNGKSTGQTSAQMLKEFNVKYVIVGHSERRSAGETDEQISKKVKNAIENGITPIICVGANADEDVSKTLKKQLKFALKYVKPDDNIVVAYEPVWAIGTGKIPTVKEINFATNLIKKQTEIAKVNAQILYGGSVNDNNFNELKTANIDGFLLGGVSLETEKLVKIILGV